jgi:hypothetical protein
MQNQQHAVENVRLETLEKRPWRGYIKPIGIGFGTIQNDYERNVLLWSGILV